MENGVNRYRVGVIGATGLVGQRLVRLLDGHPWFSLQAVAASEDSSGRRYGEAVRWLAPGEPPPECSRMVIRECLPGEMEDCDLLLSSLGSEVARDIEGSFIDAGFPVVSNSSAFRMEPHVPLVIPEVNPDHLGLLEHRPGATDGGFIVTNPNCSVIGLAMVLAPLHKAFGLRKVIVSTMQALSGAGLRGPSALEMSDNVFPYIKGEEEKIESEVGKILGEADIAVSAHCHRVAVQEGHLEAVSVLLEETAGPEDAMEALRHFRGGIHDLQLPSAPVVPIEVRTENDRPQPRLDRYAGGGMTVVVGRVRPCRVLTLRMELLSHNTVRGAAGAALLNAELLARKGLLGRGGRS